MRPEMSFLFSSAICFAHAVPVLERRQFPGFFGGPIQQTPAQQQLQTLARLNAQQVSDNVYRIQPSDQTGSSYSSALIILMPKGQTGGAVGKDLAQIGQSLPGFVPGNNAQTTPATAPAAPAVVPPAQQMTAAPPVLAAPPPAPQAQIPPPTLQNSASATPPKTGGAVNQLPSIPASNGTSIVPPASTGTNAAPMPASEPMNAGSPVAPTPVPTAEPGGPAKATGNENKAKSIPAAGSSKTAENASKPAGTVVAPVNAARGAEQVSHALADSIKL